MVRYSMCYKVGTYKLHMAVHVNEAPTCIKFCRISVPFHSNLFNISKISQEGNSLAIQDKIEQSIQNGLLAWGEVKTCATYAGISRQKRMKRFINDIHQAFRPSNADTHLTNLNINEPQCLNVSRTQQMENLFDATCTFGNLYEARQESHSISNTASNLLGLGRVHHPTRRKGKKHTIYTMDDRIQNTKKQKLPPVVLPSDVLNSSELVIDMTYSASVEGSPTRMSFLGTQTLGDVADTLRCKRHSTCFGIANDQKSEYFYVENAFYTSRKSNNNQTDLDAAVRRWILLSPRRVQKYDASELSQSLHSTLLRNLPIRINNAYLFCHAENCEHVFRVENIHRLDVSFDAVKRRAYPFRDLGVLKVQRKRCSVCIVYTAKYACLEDTVCNSQPIYTCDRCYFRLYYTVKGKLASLELNAFPL